MENCHFDADFLCYEKENCDLVKSEMDALSFDEFASNSATSYMDLQNQIVFSEEADKAPLDLSNFNSTCNMGLNEKLPYLLQYKLENGKHSKIWQCKTCGKEFGHQYTLMRHLPTHTDERKYQCNTCGKAFRQMSTLSQHKAIHSQERPYTCEVCQKTFNRISTLISHRKTHTGLKPHKCGLCHKSFHQKGNLRNHVYTHTNERPYKCDYCSKGFNQMSNLMCHKSKVHQQADKVLYSCQYCAKAFVKRAALRKHELDTHDLPGADTKDVNAVYVETIKTKAMELAVETNQTPFALLKPLQGIPVLVRVLPSLTGKQMLVPATAEDLKKHGQIFVTPRVTPEGQKEDVSGSTVQIKIPVVATVTQKLDGGQTTVSIASPGPNTEVTQENYVVN